MNPPSKLSECEIERYSRQLVLPGWGSREQNRLKQTTAAVDIEFISAALYLAAAGCGKIVLIDKQAVSSPLLSHLQNLNPDIEVSVCNNLEPVSGENELARIANGTSPGHADHLIEVTLEPASFVLSLTSAASGMQSTRTDYELPPNTDPALYAGVCAASLLIRQLVG